MESSPETPAAATGKPGMRWPSLLVVLLVPVLFALYPVISLFTVNQWEIPWRDLVRPIGGLLAVTAVLGLLFWSLARDRDPRRAAVALSLFLFLFFNEGLIRIYVLNPAHRWLALLPYAAFYYGAIALSLLIIGITLRGRYPAGKLLPTAALVGLALVVPAIGRAVWNGARHGVTAPPVAEPSPAPFPAANAPAAPSSANALPDLYCIVLDGYGRQDVLQRMYGLDNEPFLKELERRGFFIARHARANYIQTVLALSAALNLDYLRPTNRDEVTPTVLVPNIDRNAVAVKLRGKGLKSYYIATGYPLSGAIYPDAIVEPEPPLKETFTPIERLLLEKTPLNPLLVNEHIAFDKHRLKLRAAFDEVVNTAKRPEPKFVLAHLLVPHPPFVFGPNGEDVYPSTGIFKIGDATDYLRTSSAEKYKQGYADQTRYINTRVLAMVDGMLRESRRPAVIVLMGDHGPRSETDWSRLEKTNLREPFYNLMAVAVTDGSHDGFRAALTDEITPINVFRLIFTHVYGENFPRLADNSYYSTLTYPFRFTDVTPQVQGKEAEPRPLP
jgi:hypothetical protein